MKVDLLKMDNFPSHYSYHLLPDEMHICFRIKEVKDKESVKAWVDKYSKESKTTWRIRKTFPNSGKFNIYKVDYRCCHNTDRRVQGTRPSKHTGCHAKLEVTINKYIKDSHRKNADMQLINNYPCLVKLNDQHNHVIDSAEALKHRDLSPEVKEKILNLFYEGHNPATALKSYKSDLMLKLGDKYYKAAADGMLMPSYSIVYKLFKKTLSVTQDILLENQHEIPDLPCSSNIIDSPSSTSNITNIPSSSGIISDESEEDEVIRQVEGIFLRIIEKIKENKSVFLPAAQKMAQNAAKFATTDTGLLTAMYTFASYSGIKLTVSQNVLRRCNKNVIGVQPTAISKRKGSLLGKKRISAGKPRGQKTTSQNLALVSNDYTTFGISPTRKRKASHDLQTCVFDNKSLGNTKHAKQ